MLVTGSALGLAACGGTDPISPPPPPPPPPPPEEQSTLNAPGSPANLDARTSHTRGQDLPAIVFDNFRFNNTQMISDVEWQGIYCREVANAGAPVPIAQSFTISFHADDGGLPNTTALRTETKQLGQVNETFDRNVVLNCGTTSTTWGFYDYSTTLSTPFTATGGVTYWISIVANLPATDLFWGWRNGVVDDNRSVQLFNGAFTEYNLDRAYLIAP